MSRFELLKAFLGVSIMCLLGTQCFAQTDISGPTEVGNTIMPPGTYSVRDERTKKIYTLTVTTKGTMILAPAAASVEPMPASQAATTAVTPAAGAVTGTVPGAVPGAVPGIPATGGKNDAINSLINKGMQRGVKELMKHGGQKQIQNLLK